MLKGISPLITPELLYALASMGHGDGIVIADANFPAYRVAGLGQPIVMSGLGTAQVLQEILKLLPLDALHEHPGYVMEVAPGDRARMGGDPEIWESYLAALRPLHQGSSLGSIERQAFYQEAARCRCVVLTGELAPYANLILYKGVLDTRS